MGKAFVDEGLQRFLRTHGDGNILQHVVVGPNDPHRPIQVGEVGLEIVPAAHQERLCIDQLDTRQVEVEFDFSCWRYSVSICPAMMPRSRTVSSAICTRRLRFRLFRYARCTYRAPGASRVHILSLGVFGEFV